MKKNNKLNRKKSFGSVAKRYQKYRTSYDLSVYKLISSLLGGANKKYKMLDIGCGTGKSTEPLLKIFKKSEIIGCDLDSAMLKEACLSAKKLKLPISYFECLAEDMPFDNNFFDVAISGTAFHWFATKKALEEIKRVLKKDALFFTFWDKFFRPQELIIVAEVYKKYNWEMPTVNDKYDSEQLLFKKAGLKKVKICSILYTEKRLIKDIIGDIKTRSKYLLFSNEDKKSFIKEIIKAYKKECSNKKSITYKREVFICYGFKK